MLDQIIDVVLDCLFMVMVTAVSILGMVVAAGL